MSWNVWKKCGLSLIAAGMVAACSPGDPNEKVSVSIPDSFDQLKAKADTFGAVSDRGEIKFNEPVTSQIKQGQLLQSWTFKLTGNAVPNIRAEAKTPNLDLVMYLYRQNPDGGSWGNYFVKNDDCSSGTLDPCFQQSLTAGDYRLLITPAKDNMTGDFSLTVECNGIACEKPNCSGDPWGQGMICCGSSWVNPLMDVNNCGGCGNLCGELRCDAGSCGCFTNMGEQQCDGQCVFFSDPDHCGACGNVCLAGMRQCVQQYDDFSNIKYECQPCPEGSTECDGTCMYNTQFQTDNNNCGSCGNPCATGQACIQGNCVSGNGECSGDPWGQGMICCGSNWVNPVMDGNNCGGCGNNCGNLHCDQGSCRCWTNMGEQQCDGQCVFFSDPDHCGACDSICPAGLRQCVQRYDDYSNVRYECQACSSDSVECGGKCMDEAQFKTDINNCGSCGNHCATGQACIQGNCVSGNGECFGDPWGQGMICCDSTWVDPVMDVNNCGGCGNQCGSLHCDLGSCGCWINMGEQQCNGQCVFLGDPDHCGSCDNTCPVGLRQCVQRYDDYPNIRYECQPCSSDTEECGGKCTDESQFQTDINNCGACGKRCDAGQSCVMGGCIG